jgi:hypothetical protein
VASASLSEPPPACPPQTQTTRGRRSGSDATRSTDGLKRPSRVNIQDYRSLVTSDYSQRVLAFDDELTASAIRAGLDRYGQYHETIERHDTARADQLRRISDLISEEIGEDIGVAAVPTFDGLVRVCVILARKPATPEPV